MKLIEKIVKNKFKFVFVFYTEKKFTRELYYRVIESKTYALLTANFVSLLCLAC
jgi:hypothetical protein